MKFCEGYWSTENFQQTMPQTNKVNDSIMNVFIAISVEILRRNSQRYWKEQNFYFNYNSIRIGTRIDYSSMSSYITCSVSHCTQIILDQ